MATEVLTENTLNPEESANLLTNSEVQTVVKVVDPELSFIQKCLHPPSAIPGYIGIPTNDARSQVCLEFRLPTVCSTPLFLNPTTSAVSAVTQYDSQAFLSLSGLRVANVGFLKGTGTGGLWVQDVNPSNTLINDNYNFDNFEKDATVFRSTYRSLTTYLNATAFNNTGFVTVSQFNPSMTFRGVLDRMVENRPLFNNFVKNGLQSGFIKTFNSRHPDFDDLIATFHQFPKHVREDVCHFCGLDDGTYPKIDPAAKLQILNLGASNLGNTGSTGYAIPTTSQNVQASIRSYGGLAREGTFSVQRLNTIAPRWIAADNTVDATSGLYQCFMTWVESSGQTKILPMYNTSTVGILNINVAILRDTAWSEDMTMSWTIYQGLTDSLTTVPPYPILKHYIGCEIQPAYKSPWTPNAQSGPKPNLAAMQNLMDRFYDLKDGMPARYNFWGTLGAMAADGIAKFGSSILDGLLNKSKSKGDNKVVKEDNKVVKQDNKLLNRINQLEKLLKKQNINNKPTVNNKNKTKPNIQRPKRKGKKNKTGIPIKTYLANKD